MNPEVQKRKEAVFALRKFIFDTQEKYEKQILKTKAHINDLVTEADLQIERKFRETINSIFPEDKIIGEEEKTIEKEAEFCWYIDPIDGTHPYSRGIKEYGTSIGLTFKKEIVFGVIFFSEDKKAYWAIKGEGAFCEKEKISIINRPLEKSSVAIQLSKKDVKHWQNFLEKIGNTGPIYSGYSAVWYFITLATGKMDVFLITSLGGPWDVCAGILLIEEAGAKISEDLKNMKTRGFLFAATPGIYDEVEKRVR